jgi:hypothetical protein
VGVSNGQIANASTFNAAFTDQNAVSGTRASPTAIVAGTGITASTADLSTQFIQGSGGAVTVTANPRISAGTTVGQILILVGRSDTNTVTLANGNGLSQNGDVVLGEDSVIAYLWDGVSWTEMFRR